MKRKEKKPLTRGAKRYFRGKEERFIVIKIANTTKKNFILNLTSN